jgi:hypothetical protein
MSETTTFDAQAAQQAGVVTEVKAPADYWGFDETTNWYFPDEVQYLVLRKMNEGQKAQYQKLTRNDVTIARNTGDAKLKTDPAAERHALITSCVQDWHLFQGGKPVQFSERFLKDFINKADPRLVEEIEKACRKANPWLLQDMSVEDIDREIENLQEMREEKLKEQAGE